MAYCSFRRSKPDSETWTEIEEVERVEAGVWITENMRMRYAPNAESTSIPFIYDDIVGVGMALVYWNYPNNNPDAPEVEVGGL